MTSLKTSIPWTARQAFATAALCLGLGFAIGFFAHGPAHSPRPNPLAASTNAPAAVAIAPPISTEQPTPGQMKAAGSKAAIPVLEALKKDPKNFKLLVQAGEMYYQHGSYSEASGYYERALAIEDNPAVRGELAGTFYFQGKPDAALEQYERILAKNPTSDVALFNVGMIRLKAKKDAKGAIASWKKLLKAYPNHPQHQQVQSLIDKAAQQQS